MDLAVREGAAALKAGRRMLLVTHGAGRGRPRTFLQWLFDEIRAVPALRGQVALHLTGRRLPRLDGFGSVMFLLHDPLNEYPACEAEALAIAREARRRGLRLVNAPAALNNTVKSTQAAIWRKAGLPCAEGMAAANEAEMRSLIDRVRYPVILRFDPGHRQDGIIVCPDKDVALALLPRLRYPAVALRFIDTRSGWQRRDPESVMARYFHKKRAMVFPNAVHNNHVFFSSRPIVGSATSTFRAAADGETVADLDAMIAADLAYSFAPPEAPRLMQAAVRALGLDVAAIDYSTFPDGKVVLWEANPSFALPHWSQALLWRERRLQERNPRYMKALLAYFAELTGADMPA